MKIAKACHHCRTGKRRCLDEGRGLPCRHCRLRDLHCSYTLQRIHPRDAASLPRLAAKQTCADREDGSNEQLSDNANSGREDPSGTDTTELVKLYLHYIHDKPHSLFHKPTLWNLIRNEAIPKQLVFALCGVGARFSKDQRLSEFRIPLVAKSKQLLRNDIENVCISNIQTCILLANTSAADLDMSSEALYFGIANRMAHLLKLHKTDTEDPIILQETKCRVWWTLVMADTWCSSGLDLPRQLLEPRTHVRLPIDESVFQNQLSGESYILESLLTPGLWAYMIALVEIFEPIQQLNRQLADRPIDSLILDKDVSHLGRQLDHWIQTLPQNFRWSIANLQAHKDKELGGAFVALHLGYHHYSTLLYFHYLDHQLSVTPNPQMYARKCRYHARCYSEVLKASREMGDCDAVYQTVGHMTVVSSSVLLHTLLFSSADEIPVARENLYSNFSALVELKAYWPNLDQMINRLLIFQNACLRSVDANTHKIDRWMVRFLLEFALPLDEKTTEAISPILTGSPESTSGELGFSSRQKITNRALAQLFG